MYPNLSHHMNPLACLSSFCFQIVALLMCMILITSTTVAGNEIDRLALLEFKAKIEHDPSGVFNSWNDTTHFCQWYGVTCGKRHQRVTALKLVSLKLFGSISPHIGNLSFLRDLNLYDNNFNGEIPPQIVFLRRLERLDLANNSLGGVIPPNISSCSNLILIQCSNNNLEGVLPMELSSLLKLNRLALSNNRLTGTIPPSFGNVSSLDALILYQNNLSGSLPSTLGQLRNLTILALSQNSFSGLIPSSIFNLSFLRVLDIGSNYQIQGTLPPDLGISLPNLYFFSISRNQFTGTIPNSISNSSKLEVLQLDENQFTGKVPSLEKTHRLRWITVFTNNLGSGEADDLIFLSSLANTTTLEAVQIGVNNFGGKLPEQISNFSRKLWHLSFDQNQIVGNIPMGIENLINLNAFQASDNKLSGTFPPSIGKLQNLNMLYLFGNLFSGSIPPSIGNLTSLLSLRLRGNNLHGNIPASLAKCQNLLELDLSLNNFSGAIPPEIMDLSTLSIVLDLSYNRLSGFLPNQVQNLRNLGYLDVSNNVLSGEIPSSLGDCVLLEVLYMESNFFQGIIPSSLSSLKGLQRLDISRNNFSGQIPEFLAGFKSLQVLNLSYNNFEGMVPIEGVFKNATGTLVMGNRNLCGGIPEFQLPRCSFDKPKKRINLKMKVIISIISLLLGITIVLACVFCCWSRKIKRESTSDAYGNMLLEVSYQSILKATNEFSSANLIGTGSFGSVYKGILDRQGIIVAVKVLNLMRQGASKSFITECEALRNIRHRNLVKVLTACSSIDFHGNDFKALIYEFMVNGSLEEWLHPPPMLDEKPKSLNLLQRLSIAIDIACALEYLHHNCQIPIVHCDLKPSNVLLDDKMTARVSDFGLAKFISKSNFQSSLDQTKSIGVRGTIGYIPPDKYTFIITILDNFHFCILYILLDIKRWK
ncbi:probable LRR receptor-like serine/threonine-protein kinase At3g47570 [Hevea brasiliensis]|uniref:probable LRR receptor-like serine/threonine-protein kinase At3g47570 n=1 Tax=Hevea brasiliensis TaxID=3981 RepID=UPI0025E03A0A|nr:probable LRR receptor-like serine/threonine-protein kinase At3g47570 [Hevea brasiliensis]